MKYNNTAIYKPKPEDGTSTRIVIEYRLDNRVVKAKALDKDLTFKMVSPNKDAQILEAWLNNKDKYYDQMYRELSIKKR